MLRHVFAAVAALGLTALFAPACDGESLTLTDYDVTCDDASDCVGIYVGDCGDCNCPNAAINQSDLPHYQGDATALACDSGPSCDCAAPKVQCKSGKCVIGK
jgi:hypothetical protein